MDRLTSDSDDLKFLVEHLNKNTNFDGDRINAMHEKLKAYEKTGLEPEHIKKLFEYHTNRDLYDYIAELLDLDDEGLLIKLPCKVGSIVYRILYDRNIENSKVESFEFSEEGIFVRVSYESPMAYITSSYPIEDLYFTREEAEKALEVESGN